MRGQGRSIAVLDVDPLKLTCAMGWPDVQGQAHLNAAIQTYHSGLESGSFVALDEMPTLLRRIFRAAQSESATRADGVYVSIPSEYTQVYMRHVELPVRRQVTEHDLREMAAVAEEAMVPSDYRLLRCDPIAWQVDREMVYRSPVGMRGRLVQGYYALTYGHESYLQDICHMRDYRRYLEECRNFSGLVPEEIVRSSLYARHESDSIPDLGRSPVTY